MATQIEAFLRPKYPALALGWLTDPAEDVLEKGPQCLMHVLWRAARGERVVMGQASLGCIAAREGLGLDYPLTDAFPGGPDCFYGFLSAGNADTEAGRALVAGMRAGGAPRHFTELLEHGEGYVKDRELVKEYRTHIPQITPEGTHVYLAPLDSLPEGEQPALVSFLVNANQLSALTVLANYARPGIDNVRIPFGAACASLGLFPFWEAAQPNPRAVVGLIDITARFHIRKTLGDDLLSFTVPWSLFAEMEANAAESFLSRAEWRMIAGLGEE
ncbi:MAG: DUF169 domain-containing protein [Armatimonadetes bacterium]|nr:DUF169 domain-containing protein [Armatimonadota bacterium]